MKHDINKFIQSQNRIYIEHNNMIKMDINYNDLCFNGLDSKLETFIAYIGIHPESIFYGKIIGFFLYDDEIYKFIFHIHKPNQKKAHLSNCMTNLDWMKLNQNEFGTYYSIEDTSFATDGAFWNYTPLDSLTNEEDIALRKLMMALKKYSMTNHLCAALRKTDKKHLDWYEHRCTSSIAKCP